MNTGQTQDISVRWPRRVLPWHAAALVALVALLPAQAPAQNAPTISVERMTLETALQVARAALEACRDEGVQVGVTVIDRAGDPMVVLRDVLAMEVTLEISQKKANAALMFNTPLSEFAPMVDERFPTAFDVPKLDRLILTPGAVPISAAGTLYGAVGVSGAPSGMTDEACAQAGLDAVSMDLEMGGF